jgi:hypothetical protein
MPAHLSPQTLSSLLRIQAPLPVGVVCLCCGPLPVVGGVASTACSHTGATAHPKVYRVGAR